MIARHLFFVFLFSPITLFAQDKAAYKIFTSEGKSVHYEKMVKSISRSDIVFMGELHNNPIAHWLELQVMKDLYASHNKLILGMEMFEADDQIVVDEYLKKIIEERQFLKEAKVWDNYKTDYKPLIDFAREKKLDVIASNIPRRYANLVYRKGLSALDSLSDESKKWMAELPVVVDLNLKNYKDMVTEMGGHGGGKPENIVYAQAVKDATMAWFIAQYRRPEYSVLHINGAYHSQDGEGILWYLKQTEPSLKIATIHMAEQADIENLDKENSGKADFIICIPEDMTKTY